MTDPSPAAVTSVLSTPVAATLAAFKPVHVGQTLVRESHHVVLIADLLPPCHDLAALPRDGRQYLAMPVLKVFEPKPASHAIMAANHLASCPGMHLGLHLAVRKEGV